eukprot:763239-Hanusia_phi.AAC.3
MPKRARVEIEKIREMQNKQEEVQQKQQQTPQDGERRTKRKTGKSSRTDRCYISGYGQPTQEQA